MSTKKEYIKPEIEKLITDFEKFAEEIHNLKTVIANEFNDFLLKVYQYVRN